jgi:hypothetical protein
MTLNMSHLLFHHNNVILNISKMPGGLHPPLEQWLQWPAPNYVNPPTKPPYVLAFACILGPVSLAAFSARLWVRVRIQKNPGWDDILMLAAWVRALATWERSLLVLIVYSSLSWR